MAKKRLTKNQKAALAAYNECLRQEDRCGMSVFAGSRRMQQLEERTRAAYERCKALGMTWEHGL